MKSSFIFTDLSRESELNGQILSPIQSQVIQNDVASIAEQILALKFDPLNPIEFAQEDAFLKGQIQFLQHILDRSDAAKSELLSLAQYNSGNQS